MSTDPFKALDDLVKRTRTEAEAERAIRIQRTRLVLDDSSSAAFFAALAMRLKLAADWTIETAATDGKQLRYRPDWVADLKPDRLRAVLAHEVLHCALQHITRCAQFADHGRANLAADLVCNPILRDAGYTLPSCAVWPQQHGLADGMALEEYYAALPPSKQGSGGDPGGCGGTIAPADAGQGQQIDADWQVATAQATSAAQQRGKMPGALARAIESQLHPTIPWRDVLRDFVCRSCRARDDYSWSRPNRRFVGQGLYLPGLYSEKIGRLAVAVDTSGSIGAAQLSAFAAELSGIVECSPARVSIVYCDARVQRVDEWQPGDAISGDAPGGGGTSHAPVWDWLAEQDDDPVSACICLTDGYTDFSVAPDVPVLWALTHDSMAHPPFGRVLTMQ